MPKATGSAIRPTIGIAVVASLRARTRRELRAKIKSGFWRTTLAANSEKGLFESPTGVSLDDEVVAFNVAKSAQLCEEVRITWVSFFVHIACQACSNDRYTVRLRSLLCTHRERPCRSATNKRNELPPSHRTSPPRRGNEGSIFSSRIAHAGENAAPQRPRSRNVRSGSRAVMKIRRLQRLLTLR